MESHKFCIGIDGGGTKTRASLFEVTDSEREFVFEGTSTNQNSVGWEEAFTVLEHCVKGVLGKVAGSVEQVSAITLGLAGCDRAEEKARWTLRVQKLCPNAKVSVHNDGIVALASCTRGETLGIVLIAGTGTICIGMDKKGHAERCQGWGPLLGDLGSGYDVGMSVLRAVLNAYDGIGPETLLTQRLLDHLSMKCVTDLVEWVYKDENREWKQIASLSPLVEQCARQGDRVAIDIIHDTCRHLLRSVSSVLQKFADNEFFPRRQIVVGLVGGLLDRDDSMYRPKLEDMLLAKHPSKQLLIRKPSITPAYAAARMNIYHT